MRRHHFAWVIGVFAAFTSTYISAQTVGIGVDVPTATLDVRTSAPMTSLNIERILTSSALFNPAILVNDDSDYSVMEMYQLNTTNDDILAYFQNEGLGIGVWATNINPANDDPAGYFSHAGVGPGMVVYQAGSADGISVYLDDFFNLEDGVQIVHQGNGYGLFIDAYNSTQNILNYVESAVGITNVHFADNARSIEIDKAGFAGTGYSGDGYYFTNTDFLTPASGADGFSFRGYTNTISPTLGTTVFGAVLAARQYGVGHGILINHEGSSGRNAEFNILNSSNTDPAIFAVHNGDGSAIQAQNQGDVITGVIAVADISYTGIDAADHVGVAAFSAPPGNFGIGVDGYGGYIGIHGEVDPGGMAGIFSSGDLAAFGTKSFIIDHPEKPETHLLKHFSIESDQILNIYQGTIQLGRNGRATVELPSYFDDINRHFSYQLTPIGTPVQPWIAKEISDNSFVVAGKPNTRVSWMVVANRNDAYVRNNSARLKPEQAKRPSDVGKYLDPVSHGQPAVKGILYKPKPQPQPTMSEPKEDLALLRKKLAETADRGRSQANTAAQERGIAKPSAERRPPEKMEIRHEIKTWDELH